MNTKQNVTASDVRCSAVVRPAWGAECAALESRMVAIEAARPGGTLGIAVDADPLARRWQRLHQRIYAVLGRSNGCKLSDGSCGVCVSPAEPALPA